MKLCLGTVQLGMDYGIQSAGQPKPADAIDILDFAVRNGVTGLDTAPGYGTAEQVIGTFLKAHPGFRDNIEITSKLPPGILSDIPQEKCFDNMHESIIASLRRLNTDYLDVFLLHNPSHVYNEYVVDALQLLKKEGLTKRIGVSVYSVSEAFEGVRVGLDVIQVPYSIFDQRMDEEGVIALAQRVGTEIYARSIFTQGLILIEEHSIPKHLENAQPVIRKLTEFCKGYTISRLQLALSFAGRMIGISGIVFGVDSIGQLTDIIAASKKTVPQNILEEAKRLFSIADEDIILPNRWTHFHDGGNI